jgi:hypothetical protein
MKTCLPLQPEKPKPDRNKDWTFSIARRGSGRKNKQGCGPKEIHGFQPDKGPAFPADQSGFPETKPAANDPTGNSGMVRPITESLKNGERNGS